MKDFPTILLIAILAPGSPGDDQSPLRSPAETPQSRGAPGPRPANRTRVELSSAGSQLEELWGSPSWCPNPVPGPPRYAPHCPPRQPQAPIAAEGSRLLQRIVSRPQIVRCDI